MLKNDYNENDLEKYKEILIRTNAMYQHNNPISRRPKSSQSWKYRNIVKPIYESMKTAFRASPHRGTHRSPQLCCSPQRGPQRGTKGGGIIPLIKGAHGSEEIVILTPEVRACPMGEKAPPAMPQDLTSATDGGSVNVLKMSTVVSRICSTSFKKEWGL